MGWKIIEENKSPWQIVGNESEESPDDYMNQNEYYTHKSEAPGYEEPGIFNKYVVPGAAGFAERLINGLVQLKNMGNEPYQKLGIPLVPEMNLKEHLPEDYSEAAFKAGEYAPEIISGAQLAKGLTRAGINAAAKSPFVRSFSEKSTGKSALNLAEKLKGAASQQYEPIHQFAKEENIRIPNKYNLSKLKTTIKELGPKHSGSFKEYIRDDSFKNAFSAQSDLNKLVKKNDSNWANLNEHQRKATNTVRRLRDNLVKKLEHSLFQSSNPHMGEGLRSANYHYATEVAPHIYQPDILKATEGKISPEELTRRLLSERGYKYRTEHGHLMPELAYRLKMQKMNENLKKMATKGAIGGGLLAGGSYLGKKLSD